MSKKAKTAAGRQEFQTLYADLMEEVKVRFQLIDAILSGRLIMPDFLAEETCYLQLRMLCETVALCCVIAHDTMGPIDVDRLGGRYDADGIIKILEGIWEESATGNEANPRPEFFPRPINLTVTKPSPENPKGEAHFDYIEKGSLTKVELIKLYRRTGNYLHRGKVKKIKAHLPAKSWDKAAVASWTNKFVALLNAHHIAAADNERHWIVILQNANDGNRVQVALGESMAAREQSAQRARNEGRK